MSIFLSLDEHSLEQFNRKAKPAGIALIIIGVIGIVFPLLVSWTLNLFISSIFFIAAIVLAYSSYACKTHTLMMWFKPFVLFVLALLILFHPAIVISTLGLVLAVYFLMDGFASFALSVEMKPAKGWFFMLLNGVLSLILGIFVIAGWPLSSVWLVGLVIGMSFLFDGIALLAIAGNIKPIR